MSVIYLLFYYFNDFFFLFISQFDQISMTITLWTKGQRSFSSLSYLHPGSRCSLSHSDSGSCSGSCCRSFSSGPSSTTGPESFWGGQLDWGDPGVAESSAVPRTMLRAASRCLCCLRWTERRGQRQSIWKKKTADGQRWTFSGDIMVRTILFFFIF